MKITLDKEFSTRQELDHFIISRLGYDKKENIKNEIEISEEEGTKFGLSDDVNIHGVRVKVIKNKIK